MKHSHLGLELSSGILAAPPEHPGQESSVPVSPSRSLPGAEIAQVQGEGAQEPRATNGSWFSQMPRAQRHYRKQIHSLHQGSQLEIYTYIHGFSCLFLSAHPDVTHPVQGATRISLLVPAHRQLHPPLLLGSSHTSSGLLSPSLPTGSFSRSLHGFGSPGYLLSWHPAVLNDTDIHCTFNYTMSVFPIWIAASAKVEALPNLFITVTAVQALGPGVSALRMQTQRGSL